MAKRKPKPHADAPEAPTPVSPVPSSPADAGSTPRTRRKRAQPTLPAGSADALRVLVVDAHAESARDAAAALGAVIGAACTTTETLDKAKVLAADRAFDVVLIDLDSSDAARSTEFAKELLAADAASTTRVVFLARDPGFDLSVKAMRCGASDLLRKPAPPAVLGESVRAAGEQARTARAQGRRVQRLKRICRRLNTAREEVTQQVGGLCNELAAAYTDLAGQMEQVTMATEFSSLIRQELDVESLLRTTLEYLLTKTGPTNAAVFLPTGPREYSLGAYVNYDIPRETADVLLDHLADTLPQRFEDTEELLWSSTSHDLSEWVREGAGWIEGSTVLVFACRNRDECLGVATLFRDPSRPFTPEVIAQVELMRDLFTQQLARVINVHNRHKPKDQWPGFGEADEEDDYGLAA
jgi:FixJ family two-component response regulator